MGCRRAVRAAGVVVGVAALAGCGGDGWSGSPGGAMAGMDAAEVAFASMEAMAGADAVRIRYEGREEGRTGEMHLTSGGECSATMTSDEYGDMEVLQRGDHMWVGGDGWLAAVSAEVDDEELVEAARDILQERYLHIDLAAEDSAEMDEMAALCSLEDLTAAPSSPQEDEDVTFDGADFFGGTPTVTLSTTTPQGEIVVRVAAVGEPYPLEISGEFGRGYEHMEMTYDEPLYFRAPDADQTMEVVAFQRELMERYFNEPVRS
ncbi:hypothetical protein [Streptomyces millisiae]|uniref:Lipoprotein n=1 Tax=Streptomyces millisiae TaxID=3075542 RepID=A0ABU2LYI9_9ACTN|nr:hypothetical protein [Streptomyces sp. DSM 44918]MDT0322665.1 hypothetical protein [Streptomyces sp. DSM 44918]